MIFLKIIAQKLENFLWIKSIMQLGTALNKDTGNRFYADQVNQVSIQKLHQYILELDDDNCFISNRFSINCL